MLVASLRKDYNTKISKIKKKLTDHKHDKYVTSPEFNYLTAERITARLAQGNLITKTGFDNKQIGLNRKISSNKAKPVLVTNELKMLQTFDSIYFRGKSHFKEDGTQNYSLFHLMYRCFKKVAGVGSGNYI